MTAVIVLPALRSDDPLGFLAALGLVEILRSEVGVREDELKLGWEDVGGSARLASPIPTLDELVGRLTAATGRMRAENRLVPSSITDLIPPTLTDDERESLRQATGVAPPYDSIRMPREESIARFQRHEGAPDRDLRWLCALVDQTSTFPRGSDQYAHTTPVCISRSRQRVRQMYQDKLTAVVTRPEFLKEAFVGWRRNPKDAGANLDRRAERDAAVTTTGEPSNAAVTGAEWLALQSVPWFRLGGLSGRPFAWGWLSSRQGARPRSLVWPVWDRLLDPVAIEVLLSHPAVRAAAEEPAPADGGRGGPQRGALRDEARLEATLRGLGVRAVLRADRTVLTNSDGPLGPSRVVWPRRPLSAA